MHGHLDPARPEPFRQGRDGRAPLPKRAVDGLSDEDAGGDLPRPVETASLAAAVLARRNRARGIGVAARPVGRETVLALQGPDDALGAGEVLTVAHGRAVAPDPQGDDVDVAAVANRKIGVVPETLRQRLGGRGRERVARLRCVGTEAQHDVGHVPPEPGPQARHGPEGLRVFGGVPARD